MSQNEITNSKSAHRARIALGASILRELNVLPSYISAFEKKGLVIRSEEPFGFAYYANKKEQSIIDEMEQAGKTVYAIIKGRYKIGPDTIDMLSYLYVANDDVELASKNLGHGFAPLTDILTPVEGYGYEIIARVIGFDDEEGYIGVIGQNGGLHRTY